jgi:hypothetical protein
VNSDYTVFHFLPEELMVPTLIVVAHPAWSSKLYKLIITHIGQ